jgi:hypothetical protein
MVMRHLQICSTLAAEAPPPLTASVAVVWRTEYGDHVLVVAPVVALHHELVRAADQVKPVGVVELLADVLQAWDLQCPS